MARTSRKQQPTLQVVPTPRVNPPERKGFEIPKTQMVAIGNLNPAPYNPRKISPQMLESLKANIRLRGFLVQMVVQKHSIAHGPMVILGGHQRLRAVREICIEDNVAAPPLPTVILDVDDRTAKTINIALNRIDGEFDRKLLGEVLDDINTIAPVDTYEEMVMGFDHEEFQTLLHMGDPPVVTPEGPPETFGRSVTLSLEFNDVRDRDAVKAKLVDLARESKKTTGEVVLAALSKRR
jgi:hypothetical protein